MKRTIRVTIMGIAHARIRVPPSFQQFDDSEVLVFNFLLLILLTYEYERPLDCNVLYVVYMHINQSHGSPGDHILLRVFMKVIQVKTVKLCALLSLEFLERV